VELLWIFGALGLVTTLVWWGSDERRINRALRKARRFRIADLGDGSAGLVAGHVQIFQEHLVAPLSGRVCVHYIAVVERHHRQNHFWETVARETAGVPFVLEDSTGRAVVDATGATVTLDFDSLGTSRVGDEPTDEPTDLETAFLKRHLTTGKRWWLSKCELRYREAVIEIGETVAVVGEGTREPDPDAAPTGGFRDPPPTRLRLTSSRKHPLIITDALGTRGEPVVPPDQPST
jgi:hypothetical protein